MIKINLIIVKKFCKYIFLKKDRGDKDETYFSTEK